MPVSAVSHDEVARSAVLPAGNFVVGEWFVEPDLDRVSRDGVSVHVRPKLMDLLVYLARNTGRTVPHEELLAGIWPGQRFMASTALPRCIAELRQTLGDRATGSTVIQTIPKRGYRLIARVRSAPDALTACAPQLVALPPSPRAERRVLTWWARARQLAARVLGPVRSRFGQ